MSCIACDAEVRVETWYGSRCETCGLGHSDIQAVHGDGFFDGYYGRYFAREDQWAHEARKRLAYVAARYSRPHRLLEIGCGGGYFLTVASRHIYDYRMLGTPLRRLEVFGIEPDDIAAQHARKRGLHVHSCTVEDADFPPGNFDTVCAWHVLEHVADPLTALTKVRAWMMQGAPLFLEVPNAASRPARRRDWPHHALGHHVWHFTPTALRLLVERAGFVVDRDDLVSATEYVRGASRIRAYARRLRHGGGDFIRLIASAGEMDLHVRRDFGVH